MKKITVISLAAVGVALAAAFLLPWATEAPAQVVPPSPAIGAIACTNNVPNNSTTTANMGSAVDCSQYGEVGIQITGKLDGAGTTVCTFNFVKSADGTNYATVSQHPISFTPAGTTTVTTNVSLTVGALPYLKLLSITAANNSANLTNIVVQYVFKPARKEYLR